MTTPPRTIWNISSLCHVQAGPVTLFFLFSATGLLFVGGVTLDVGHCSIASSEGIMFDLFWPKTVWSRKNINCHHSTVLLLPLEMKKFHPNLSTSANLSGAAAQRRLFVLSSSVFKGSHITSYNGFPFVLLNPNSSQGSKKKILKKISISRIVARFTRNQYSNYNQVRSPNQMIKNAPYKHLNQNKRA